MYSEERPVRGGPTSASSRRRLAAIEIGAILNAGFSPIVFPISGCGAADAQAVGLPLAILDLYDAILVCRPELGCFFDIRG